ncbi:MAG TPA: hypothetical protein VFY76_06740 [Nocardioides sp.]|nr:hypothetical protein [Nocardioides sp.]
MSDDQTQPVRPGDPAATPPPPPPPAASEAASETAGETAGGAATPPTTGGRGFRERLRALRRSDGSRTFGLAALIASALAGVIVGGLGYAAIDAVSDDRDHDRGAWVERRDGEGPGRGDMHDGPRGVPGLLPPTAPPEDGDSSSS